MVNDSSGEEWTLTAPSEPHNFWHLVSLFFLRFVFFHVVKA